MAEESPAAARLRGELLRARDRAGLSGRQMADRLGISQGTLWRIDTGRQLPTMPRVKAWLDACGVRADRQQHVLELAERVHGETRPWRELLGGDNEAGHLQETESERDARLVQNFQPTIVPGLLQTPDYARLALTLGHTRDVDAAVQTRIERQQAMRDSDTRHEFVVGERALRASLGDHTILAGQLEVLLRAAKDGAAVAVLPDSAPLRPWNNFVLWTPRDDGPRYFTAELVHGWQRVETPEDVEVVVGFWEQAWSLSLHGDDAADLIRRARG